MEITLFIISAILLLTGFCGCILPVLPGVPLSLIGLLILHFTEAIDFTFSQFAFFIGITILVQAADYFTPIWLTKKFGGSKWGVVGSALGLVVGLFFGPVGIIFGPIIGAILFEFLSKRDFETSLRAGLGSFLGFLLNTGLKLIVCGYFIWKYVQYVW